MRLVSPLRRAGIAALLRASENVVDETVQAEGSTLRHDVLAEGV